MFKRFGVNYVHTDFLTWEPKMKFDVVIGNPPYHKNKYSDFYVCFMQRAAKVLKDGGFFPCSHLQKVLSQCHELKNL